MSLDVREVSVADLTFDDELQSRVGINSGVVTEYAEAWQRGDAFPPLTVFDDGEDMWVADGFHRGLSARMAGRETVPCLVRSGSKRDAMFHAIAANGNHGLRRSDEDKRRAIRLLLADVEWSTMSTKAIADHVHVSQHLVNRVRKENPNWDSNVRIGANGIAFRMTGRKEKLQAWDSGREVTRGAPVESGPRLELWRDADGNPLPAELRQGYSDARWLAGEAHEAIARAVEKLETLASVPAAAGMPMSEILASLNAVSDRIAATMPHSLCPQLGDNHGPDCSVCRGSGFMGR